MPALVTRVFMNGNSQAVRIPQELRLDATRVEISRTEAGDLIIHPLPADRGTALLEALQGFDDDFIRRLEDDREALAPTQERDAL
ncbi:antitoxin [Aquabacterium sp.]|uniref:antitoxin n=1 Tax=Aquabacterium sp. TaxID=1872578 RepID=UPI002B710B48|nr:AbrB/MazE/SpoVT family DNA-binding domain-containing protein [Aquabacterium sp.]HSW09115.1 AbrB/MazE/SpoVT family DNA-binding domain-containing protein [Aquabacterium sp.]